MLFTEKIRRLLVDAKNVMQNELVRYEIKMS